jgi:hypothetical protein
MKIDKNDFPAAVADCAKFLENLTVNDLVSIGHSNNVFPLFSKQDLANRWSVTRYVVGMWALRHDDFPKPVEGITLTAGPLYPLYEVKRYEKARKLNE